MTNLCWATNLLGEVWRHVTMVAKFLDLNNFSWRRLPFALLNDGRKVWVTVLILSAIMHRKVIHVSFFFFFSAILAGLRFVEDQKFSTMATWRNDYSPSSSNTLFRFKCISLLKKTKSAANRRVVRQPRSLQSSYLYWHQSFRVSEEIYQCHFVARVGRSVLRNRYK